MWRVASTILNNGVKSLLRACEVQPPGQGGIKILVTVVSPCDHAAYVPAVFVHEPGVLQFINRRVDIPAACRSWYAQCTLCGCFAPVVVQRQVPWLGRAQTVEFRSCRFSGVAQCLVRLWIPVQHHPGWLFGRISTIFHVTGWTRILGSILVVHCTHGR